jgi:hypothetical protein
MLLKGRLVGEALGADGVAAAHPAKHRPAVALRGLEPLAQRTDGTAVCLTRVGLTRGNVARRSGELASNRRTPTP